MTVEDILKRRFASILLQETPYVLEEARFGMFDIAAYVPEESAFEGLGESKKLSAVRACNKYQLDGTCTDKQKEFLKNFEPVYDDHCLLTGFRDRTKDIVISEHDFNMLISDKKIVQRVIACDVDEEGKGCEKLNERLQWDQGFLAGNGLKQGLHLLEFKSDHDNVNRFLEQLPHYSLFADFIWLIIGSEQKVPKWLPSYVGVYQEKGEGFVKLKESTYVRRLPPMSRAVLRECGVPDGAMNDEALYSFMKKWFVNSIFYKSNGLVMPMNDLDKLFKAFEEKKRAKQSTLKF
jgi:hypothetical protein